MTSDDLPQGKNMITKRQFLVSSASIAAVAAAAGLFGMRRSESFAEEVFEITKTEEEWRAILTPDQYAVLRTEATEPPGTSPLLDEHREGTFHCAGCDLALFSSATKFDSGTGWPSFWQEIDGAVAFKEDNALFMTRIEEHCRRCGGHLGHVFDDGPPPTGKRHCINGIALVFKPAAAGETG
jgi:peptide-methionine (R)-S-oxide reductase